MTTFNSMPAAVTATALDLEQIVFDSLLNSCARKSSLRPTDRRCEEFACRRHVGLQPVDFLTQIGLGGNQRDFLMQAVAVEA